MKKLTRIAFAITALFIEIVDFSMEIMHLIFRGINRRLPRLLQNSLRRVRDNYRFILKQEREQKNQHIEYQAGQAKHPDYQESRSYVGDVPGWVLVVLMTTGLVTAIWTIAAPRLSTILRNSLDAMNGIR